MPGLLPWEQGTSEPSRVPEAQAGRSRHLGTGLEVRLRARCPPPVTGWLGQELTGATTSDTQHSLVDEQKDAAQELPLRPSLDVYPVKNDARPAQVRFRAPPCPLVSPGPVPGARGSGAAQLLLPRGPKTPRKNGQEATELGMEGVYFTGQACGRETWESTSVWGQSPQRHSQARSLGADGGQRGDGSISGRSSCLFCQCH